MKTPMEYKYHVKVTGIDIVKLSPICKVLGWGLELQMKGTPDTGAIHFDDDEDSDIRNKILRDEMRKFMLLEWGKKCNDFEPECVLCKAWQAFDYLFNHIDDNVAAKPRADGEGNS